MDIQNLMTECLNSEKHEISNAARIGIINYKNDNTYRYNITPGGW